MPSGSKTAAMQISASILDTRARQIAVSIARIDRSGHHLRCRKYFNRFVKPRRMRLVQALGHISDMREQQMLSTHQDSFADRTTRITEQNVPYTTANWLTRLRFFFLSLLKLLK